MEKQEVKSILDRLFDLSEKANEKSHTMSYSIFNRSHAISLIYFKGDFIGTMEPTVNTYRPLNITEELELLEADIKLIESHLNS